MPKKKPESTPEPSVEEEQPLDPDEMEAHDDERLANILEQHDLLGHHYVASAVALLLGCDPATGTDELRRARRFIDRQLALIED